MLGLEKSVSHNFTQYVKFKVAFITKDIYRYGRRSIFFEEFEIAFQELIRYFNSQASSQSA